MYYYVYLQSHIRNFFRVIKLKTNKFNLKRLFLHYPTRNVFVTKTPCYSVMLLIKDINGETCVENLPSIYRRDSSLIMNLHL